MKKALVTILTLLFFALPGYAADEYKDYLIRGMPDYTIYEQIRNYDQLAVSSVNPENKRTEKTNYEGNRVYSEYRYGGDKTSTPSRLQVKRYYQSALDKLGGVILWEDDSGFHASFTRGGRQNYMTVASSNGERYQLSILDVAELKNDVNVVDDDAIFSGMSNYNLANQRKNFDQLAINSMDPETKRNVKTNYEGACVFSEYRYGGDKMSKPSNTQVKRNYQNAMVQLGGETLWEDDASFHASFKRNGKQYYMTVWSSRGDRYQVNILALTDLDMDVLILDDDILDDNGVFIDEKPVEQKAPDPTPEPVIEVEILEDDLLDDNGVVEDVKSVEPKAPDPTPATDTTPAIVKDFVSEFTKLFKKAPDPAPDPTPVTDTTPEPEKNIVSEFAKLFKKAPDTSDTDHYTLGNDKITSIIKVVGERKVVRSNTEAKDDITAMVIEYSTDPNDMTQAANDIAKYFQYVMANDGFLALKSFDGLPYEGGIEMSFAKDSVDAGNIVLLDIDYNSKGYTLLFRKGKGSLTRE